MNARVAVVSMSIAFITTAACPAETVLWLEAERFDQPGGWVNDAQFVDQMGSPYLLAIGLNGPVSDACTKASIPASGRYRLWVRCRDWDVEHSPGKFLAVLGGRQVDRVFGQTKQKGWVWEDGGVHDLAAGELTIRLHDLTGHYSRCDVVLLTDELNYQPPADLGMLAQARQRYGGVSREATRMPPYDTVVVGGGLAGTIAAIASARSGAKTALLQDRPVLGGNSSSEILVAPQGDTTHEPLDPGEGGIIEEFRGSLDGYSNRMLELVKNQANLDLYLNTHATGVEMRDSHTIASVKAMEVTTGRRFLFRATAFIDCTGDGAIGVWAGNQYRHGREPRSMYNESRAPETADSHTMGGTLRYATERRFEPVSFQAPAWARKFRQPSDFKQNRYPQLQFGGWQWVIEYGGLLNTYDDAEEIRDELLRIIWGMWDYAKNHSLKLKEEGQYYKLTWVSHVVGKRESRRLIGDYVMTEHDVANQSLFDDRVAYCGWGIDLHPPAGFYDDEPPATFSHKLKFSVPLRSLYAKDIRNLMMAGRCISVSHCTLGATRVMISCGVQGEAVGIAAGLCRKHSAIPRDLYREHITELQQLLLKNGCYLIDLPNRDPADLALPAKASASSVATPGSLYLEGGTKSHPLECDRAVMFRVAEQRIEKILLYLVSEADRPTELKLTLRPATRLDDFGSREDLATATAQVPPKNQGWVEFPLGIRVKPGLYYAWLPPAPKLSWSLFECHPADTSRAYRASDGWHPMSESYAFRIEPPARIDPPGQDRSQMFAASNVNNGFARAIRGWPNSWRPDPQAPLPQWVELDFGKVVAFDTVHVSFQTQDMRATAFQLQVPDGQRWRTIAEIRDNSRRRRVIGCEPTEASKLRLVILEARPQMGVCEIRVYPEKR